MGLHQAPCRPLHAPGAPSLLQVCSPSSSPPLPSLPPLSVSLSFLSSSLTLSLTSNASSSLPAQHGPTFLLSQKSGHRTGAQAGPPRGPTSKPQERSLFPCLLTCRLMSRQAVPLPEETALLALPGTWVFRSCTAGGQSLGLSSCKAADEPEADSSSSDHGADMYDCLAPAGTRCTHVHTQPVCRDSHTRTCSQMHTHPHIH